VTIQEAVQTAKHYLSEVLPEAGGDILLEEIERSHDNHWQVTLSFPRRRSETLADALRPSREYKVVSVNDLTGMPESIKIRDLAR
jgi:hypothetical protein